MHSQADIFKLGVRFSRFSLEKMASRNDVWIVIVSVVFLCIRDEIQPSTEFSSIINLLLGLPFTTIPQR